MIFNGSHKTCSENQTHFSLSIFFSKIVLFKTQRGQTLCSWAGHRWQYNTAHAHCMLDTQGYTHTHTICNSYCFPTATMTAQSLLNVTLHVRCLSWATDTNCISRLVLITGNGRYELQFRWSSVHKQWISSFCLPDCLLTDSPAVPCSSSTVLLVWLCFQSNAETFCKFNLLLRGSHAALSTKLN